MSTNTRTGTPGADGGYLSQSTEIGWSRDSEVPVGSLHGPNHFTARMARPTAIRTSLAFLTWHGGIRTHISLPHCREGVLRYWTTRRLLAGSTDNPVANRGPLADLS